jgi:hypothetical protein
VLDCIDPLTSTELQRTILDDPTENKENKVKKIQEKTQ